MPTLGPDAARYMLAGDGHRVARPFNLRWSLPLICGTSVRRWWVVWAMSWPVAAAGAVLWAHGVGMAFWPALAVAGLLLGLPGCLGPAVARPVQVDMPAMAVGLVAAACWVNGWHVPAVALTAVAATGKESSPVWVALWCWSPWPLLALVVPAVTSLVRKPELDSVTARPLLRHVHDHPVRSALEHHAGRWRDAWLWVAPWGATVAALVPPSTQTVTTLLVAHAQMLLATDTVRLLATTAGPVMALAAAQHIPPNWLLLAVVVNLVWWRRPELV